MSAGVMDHAKRWLSKHTTIDAHDLITAFIIVMEMVSGPPMVLSLMACSMIASGVGRLVSKTMYTELAARLKLPPTVPEPVRGKP